MATRPLHALGPTSLRGHRLQWSLGRRKSEDLIFCFFGFIFFKIWCFESRLLCSMSMRSPCCIIFNSLIEIKGDSSGEMISRVPSPWLPEVHSTSSAARRCRWSREPASSQTVWITSTACCESFGKKHQGARARVLGCFCWTLFQWFVEWSLISKVFQQRSFWGGFYRFFLRVTCFLLSSFLHIINYHYHQESPQQPGSWPKPWWCIWVRSLREKFSSQLLSS